MERTPGRQTIELKRSRKGGIVQAWKSTMGLTAGSQKEFRVSRHGVKS